MIKQFRKYKRMIDNEGFTPAIVNKIINEHKPYADRMKQLYDRYDTEPSALPIKNRESMGSTVFDTHERVQRLDKLISNAIGNSWDAEIVDTKVGYLLGHAISYTMDDTEDAESDPSKRKYAPQQELLEQFLLRNNMDDEDSELGKLATICGYAGRLLYVADDGAGSDRVMLIEPWECVFIGKSLQEPDYSVYYYDMDGIQVAECYDDTTIHTFTNEGNEFKLVDAQPHLYELNPLFGCANNRELKGDAERVLDLIDAYDRTISDVASEIEQYRLAYLVAKGVALDPEDMERVNQNGIFELFGKDDALSYLTKDVNDGMIENFLDRLERNINRFAKNVDFTDDSFGTQVTGIAMKIKTMSLENKSVTMERKFTAMLRYEMRVLFSAWAKRYKFDPEDYLKVIFSFKRNLPVNLLDEAQTTQALMGAVSEETRLAELSFVDDVRYEIEKMQQERDNIAPLEDDPFDDADDNDDAEEPKVESGE